MELPITATRLRAHQSLLGKLLQKFEVGLSLGVRSPEASVCHCRMQACSAVRHRDQVNNIGSLQNVQLRKC